MATSSQQPSARLKLKTTFGSLRHRPSPVPVPSGTVASRVSYLQSLATSATNRASSTRSSPSSPKARNTVKSERPFNDEIRVDDDRSGRGRRTSATFGYPTQRSNGHLEDPPEEKKHTIMGWQMRRAKNDSDNKSINSIKSGSDKKGFRDKVKDVFGHSDRSAPVSPEIIYANTRTVSISVRDRAKDYGVPDRETRRIYAPSSTAKAPSPSRRSTIIRAPPGPKPLAKVASRDFAEEAIISGHKVHNWLAGHGSGSEASNGQSVATTSTGRVRSVQQMYTSYGIPEPSELFSKALPISKVVGGDPRRCHVCKWVNVGVERCSCCGHRLCADCVVELTMEKLNHKTETAEVAQLLLEDDYSGEGDSTYSHHSISHVARKTSIEFKSEVFGRTASGRKRSSRHSPKTLKKPTVHKVGIFEERFDLPARDPSIALARAYTTGDGASPPNRNSLAEPQAEAEAEDLTILYQPLKDQPGELTASPPIPSELVLEYARTLSPPRMVASEAGRGHKKSMVKDSPFLKADKKDIRKPPSKLKRATHKGAQHVHLASDKFKAVDAAHRIVASSAAAKDVTPRAPKPQPLHPTRHVAAHPATSKDQSPPASTRIETFRQDDEMSSVKCDSPTCRATHDGYRPYRHSISCSKRKIGESVSSTATSPKDVMTRLQMSPLMPKPLSPTKRKAEEVKIDDVLSKPADVPFKNDRLVNENVVEKIKKVSAESARLTGQSSPSSKAVVAVLSKPTELISPLGSDGHEDGSPAQDKTAVPPAPSSGSIRKRDVAEFSSNGSDFATITSTGQITTIYETSITERPLHLKNKRHNQQRLAHRRGRAKRLSISSGPARPSRGSAERSHEELVRRKHQVVSSQSTTALGFCPPVPHIHRIERSTEYIECYPETGIPEDRARKSSMTYHNMDRQNDQSPSNVLPTEKEVNRQNTNSRQRVSNKNLPQANTQEQDSKGPHIEIQDVMDLSTKDVSRENSIDRGTFTTTRTKRGQHQQNSASDAASACVPPISDSHPPVPTTQDALNNEELAQMEADHNSASQGHSAQNFLKQVGSTVKRQGKNVLAYDPLERIVKPRIGLQERKRRAKYGDMDPALASSNQDSDFDTMGQPRNASSGSSTDKSIVKLQPTVVSDTSEEPGPSSRTRYADRRQKKPEEQDRNDVHYRKDGVMHSRKIGSGGSLEHLDTQPSFGTDYRHQSYPEGVSHEHAGPPVQQRAGQSFAGHETSHHNTGIDYSDKSSDSYFDDNHSTMSGMSREIVFESGPHGKGVVLLPVVVAEETRYSDGSDLDRGQSRKINRAGLRMSKSVRHVTGAAGPKIPVAMPITMEDNTAPVPAEPLHDEAEGDNGLQRRGTVNRAGLKMTNSVRHIIGADGPTSFSHTPAHQIPTPPSADTSQTSVEYSDSTFSREEALRRGIPMAPERIKEYNSYRLGQSHPRAPSYSSYKSGSIYQGNPGIYTVAGSAGQLSSRLGEGERQEPAPSREQPYYYASAPPPDTAAELDNSRAHSFSASKTSLFDEQVTDPQPTKFFSQIDRLASQSISPAASPEKGTLDWWEIQSLGSNRIQDQSSEKLQNVSTAAPSKMKARMTRRNNSQIIPAAFSDESLTGSNESIDVDALRKAIDQGQGVTTDKLLPNMKKHSAFRKTLAASAKRRMEEAHEVEGGKKRKLSNGNEEEPHTQANKVVFISEAKAAKEPMIHARQGATTVQKLKEKFSASAAEKSTPPVMIDPFRQHKDHSSKALHPSSESATATSILKGGDTVGHFAKLASPAAFSTDGGRSRISTLSTQQAPSLPIVSEVSIVDQNIDKHTTERYFPVPNIFKWKEKSISISQNPDVAGYNAASKVMTLGGELPSGFDAIMPHIERGHIAPERLDKLESTRQYYSSGQVSISKVVSNQMGICLFCKAVVLKVGLAEHHKQCFKKTEGVSRGQKEEKEAAIKESEKLASDFVKNKGKGGDLAKKVLVHGLASTEMHPKGGMNKRNREIRADRSWAAAAEASTPKEATEMAMATTPEVHDQAGKVVPRTWLVPAHDKVAAGKMNAQEKELGDAGNDLGGEQKLVRQARGALDQAELGQADDLPVKRSLGRPRKIRTEEEAALSGRRHEQYVGRGRTVSMLAEKFQRPSAEPAGVQSATAVNHVVGPLFQQKKVSHMGADGAVSTTPAPVSPRQTLSRQFTLFLAAKFELRVEELGEITVEIGNKDPLEGPLAAERRSLGFEAWKRAEDM